MRIDKFLDRLMECRNLGHNRICNSILGAIIDAIKNCTQGDRNIILKQLTRLMAYNNADPYMPIIYRFDGEGFEGVCFSAEDHMLLIVFQEEVKLSDEYAPVNAVYVFKGELEKIIEAGKAIEEMYIGKHVQQTQ